MRTKKRGAFLQGAKADRCASKASNEIKSLYGEI